MLDTSQSVFYQLDIYREDNNINSGKITLFSNLDYKIKSPLIEKKIVFYAFQTKKDTIDIISFESQNKNYVEFKFENISDTIVGILMEQRLIDTIVNGEKLVRIIESLYPIDNKVKTNNPFIEAFELQ